MKCEVHNSFVVAVYRQPSVCGPNFSISSVTHDTKLPDTIAKKKISGDCLFELQLNG